MRLLITGGSGFVGTNAVARALELGIDVLNVDCAAPRIAAHHGVWRASDIRDGEALHRIIADFRPTHTVHLAARTDLRGRNIEDYSSNTIGTSNLAVALLRSRQHERALSVSSMLVCPNGIVPRGDTDYRPNTVYGRSKALSEVTIRRLPASGFHWCIVRPTSIWGPWFDEPYKRFFEMVVSGRYVHPGHTEVYKHMGFVQNTVAQIFHLLGAPDAAFHKKTYYLGDYERYSTGQMAETIRREAQAPRIRRVPVAALRLAGIAGDAALHLGLDFPLTSFRLRNMLTASYFDLSALMRVTGGLPVSMERGVQLTLDWLRRQGPA